MITSWDIYWITRLDAIYAMLVIVLIVVVLAMIFLPMIADIAFDAGTRTIAKLEIIGFVIFVVALSMLTFIPSTREAAAIYLIPKIANNEQMQKIPDNAAKLLNAKMEQWIDYTLAEKKKEKE